MPSESPNDALLAGTFGGDAVHILGKGEGDKFG